MSNQQEHDTQDTHMIDGGTEMDEYLRRNLLVAKAYGALAGVDKALADLRALKRQPKGLISRLEGVRERIKPLPGELAKYRGPVPQKARNESDKSATQINEAC